jgi:beta-glucosidase/6-phospho-beta-glucosidase/beta-galactosidase
MTGASGSIANAERLARESEQAFRWNPNWSIFRAEATDPDNYISGAACEHYSRYESDFDLAASLGHNAHRFSIEWSRIEPREGEFDEAAIEHYRQVIARSPCSQYGTFHHSLALDDLPLWLTEKGGIMAPGFSEYFERYTETIVESTAAWTCVFGLHLMSPMSILLMLISLEPGHHKNMD